MKTFEATVLGRRQLSEHLVSITLGGLAGWASTGIPDEYVRLLIAPEGAELALPTIDDAWNWTLPDGATPPEPRVYTISDHRIVDGDVRVDIDIALHDEGVGSDWARSCRPGDKVGIIEPHGLYAAPARVGWQLLVCDLTGVPALGRILRGLEPGQRVEARVVVTSADDEVPLPSPADVDVTWQVVDRETDLTDALSAAVLDRELPAADRYVWFAGEARASRAVRKHLRRTLGWPQTDFYTCGYWQIDAERWNARYEAVAEKVDAELRQAYESANGDQGAYLDAIDEIYESAGL